MVTEEYAPGPAVGDMDDEAILEWVRNTATTIYHPTGTCKMGPDRMAVVDRGSASMASRVCGSQTPRSCPVITSGNTNAPSIMIGEKASDLIMEDAS